MRVRISLSTLLKIAAITALLAGLLPFVSPVHATTAAIGQFYASCGQFSVDVAVNGANNDGNNFDKFRYQVTDGSGKVLYIEDAARQVGVTAGSLVLNLNYNVATPNKNPIKIAVIELDGNNQPGAEVMAATYDATCLAASGAASRSGTFVPPKNVGGNIITTTNIFAGPNGDRLNLVVGAGSSWNVLYRTPDNQWVAIYVGSSNLVWIPARTISTDLNALATPPTRIDGSSLQGSPGSSSGAVVIAPGTVIATVVVTTLNLRASPSVNAKVLATIPFKTTLPVLGRSPAGAWLKVTFSGMQGWVSSRFIRLSGGLLSSLPIVS